MKRVIISLGSNLPGDDGEASVNDAVTWLRRMMTDVCASTVYTTPALGAKGNDYTNCVIAGYTTLSADRLEVLAKEYEIARGRTEETRLADIVPIDIDLVVYGTDTIRPRELTRSYFLQGFSQLH